jgi:hypothetical protein
LKTEDKEDVEVAVKVYKSKGGKEPEVGKFHKEIFAVSLMVNVRVIFVKDLIVRTTL